MRSLFTAALATVALLTSETNAVCLMCRKLGNFGHAKPENEGLSMAEIGKYMDAPCLAETKSHSHGHSHGDSDSDSDCEAT